ncbi:hypothetical protein [Psychromicrobium xiongbiense]|uniref:hypothetical protein n=1 Tax=Psychromicrobium xiongbiense TaxID=3051184 RepID=UPI002553CE69|nr:hypothetical protein [Psychromicrobium sp. YIM S02556]
MSEQSPKSLFDRLIGLCLSLLVGAVALWCAVQVVQSILPFIIIGVGLIALVWAGWILSRFLRDRFF